MFVSKLCPTYYVLAQIVRKFLKNPIFRHFNVCLYLSEFVLGCWKYKNFQNCRILYNLISLTKSSTGPFHGFQNIPVGTEESENVTTINVKLYISETNNFVTLRGGGGPIYSCFVTVRDNRGGGGQNLSKFV